MGRLLATAMVAVLAGSCAAEAPTPTASPATTQTPAPPTPAPPRPTPTLADPTPQAVEQLTIRTPEGNDTVFVPDEARVTAGSRVMLTYENASTAPHNLTFRPPMDARTQPVVESGQTATLELTVPAAGEYEFYCTLHPWMTGTLVVSAASPD